MDFPPREIDPMELRINFDQFCALATESAWRFKSNGVSCESEIPSVWSILCRKASKFLRRAIVQPFNRFLGISYSQKLCVQEWTGLRWCSVRLVSQAFEQSRYCFMQPIEFSDWTNSLMPESDQRDLYVGVIGKDQFWLETSAASSIEWAFEM